MNLLNTRHNYNTMWCLARQHFMKKALNFNHQQDPSPSQNLLILSNHMQVRDCICTHFSSRSKHVCRSLLVIWMLEFEQLAAVVYKTSALDICVFYITLFMDTLVCYFRSINFIIDTIMYTLISCRANKFPFYFYVITLKSQVLL